MHLSFLYVCVCLFSLFLFCLALYTTCKTLLLSVAFFLCLFCFALYTTCKALLSFACVLCFCLALYTACKALLLSVVCFLFVFFCIVYDLQGGYLLIFQQRSRREPSLAIVTCTVWFDFSSVTLTLYWFMLMSP